MRIFEEVFLLLSYCKENVFTHINCYSRLVAEVEVGGWPVPTVTWFKDDEILTTKTHTENYNGFPNKYVPDSRIEVIRLGKINLPFFSRSTRKDGRMLL